MALTEAPDRARSPSLARLLIKYVVRDPDQEFLLGDLEEIHRQLSAERGRSRARIWFWKQALLALVYWVQYRFFSFPQGEKDEEQSMLSSLRKDLFYAVRLAFKRPGFSLVVVLTLALGIGANTAVYSLTSAFLLRQMPVAAADRLVSVFRQNKDGSFESNLSYPQIQDYREQSQTLKGVLGFSLVRASLRHAGMTEMIFGETVTGNYFDVLGVTPRLGRTFLAEEYQAQNMVPVVVLSDGFWKSRFGSDPRILGATIELNGVGFNVIGVAPPSFAGSKFALSMSFWIPVQTLPQFQKWEGWNSRQSHWMNALGRLKDGVTLQDAQAELEVISRRQQQDYPADQRDRVARAQWARGVFAELDPSMGSSLGLASGLAVVVAILVLLIACANVANLLLARTSTRVSELGLRMAMGASRRQLFRQLTLESLVLAIGGGLLGILLAFVGTSGLPLLFPPIPYEIHFPVHPDLSVLGLTLLVTTITGLLFGFVPLLALGQGKGLMSQLRQASNRTVHGGWKSRRLLVVFQLAASLVLLVVSGLFVRSLQNAQTVDPGFSNSNLLIATIDMGLASYTQESGLAALPELESELRSIVGVEAVGLSSNLPLDDSNEGGLVWGQGKQLTQEEGLSTEFARVSPGLFAALGIELLEGRFFGTQDRSDTPPVALISHTLAERLWPGEPKANRMLSLNGPAGPFIEVVGVVDDVKYRSLSIEQVPAIYLNLHQHFAGVLGVVLKTSLPPASLTAGLRAALRKFDSRIPVFREQSLDEHLGNLLWPSRMGATLASIFGLIAVLLAAVGLYGLMSFTVSRRVREMGIRTALGANRSDLLRLILASGSRLVLTGIALGAFISILAVRPISSILYGIGGVDWVTLGTVGLVLTTVALVACYVPARRAARTDPIDALRHE